MSFKDIGADLANDDIDSFESICRKNHYDCSICPYGEERKNCLGATDYMCRLLGGYDVS